MWFSNKNIYMPYNVYILYVVYDIQCKSHKLYGVLCTTNISNGYSFILLFVYRTMFANNIIQCTTYIVWRIQCTTSAYSVHHIVYSVHHTSYNMRRTLYNVFIQKCTCTVYDVHVSCNSLGDKSVMHGYIISRQPNCLFVIYMHII